MIRQILEHLDGLQIALSSIDPTRNCDAADKVAELATALRDALPDVRKSEFVAPAVAARMSAAAWARQIRPFTRSPA